MTDLHALLSDLRECAAYQEATHPDEERCIKARGLLARIDAALAEPQPKPVAEPALLRRCLGALAHAKGCARMAGLFDDKPFAPCSCGCDDLVADIYAALAEPLPEKP